MIEIEQKQMKSILAIVAIAVIFMFFFRVTGSGATGNVVYYDNVVFDTTPNSGYNSDENIGEFDSKRPVYTEDSLPATDESRHNFAKDITKNKYVHLQEDHKPEGKVYLKRTYEIYRENGEVNFVFDVYDKDGVEKVIHDRYDFEKGYHANAVKKQGTFQMGCNGNMFCEVSYPLARNVRDFYTVFEDYEVEFHYRDSKGNVRYGVLNEENDWTFVFE